jgi:hypothetical protein
MKNLSNLKIKIMNKHQLKIHKLVWFLKMMHNNNIRMKKLNSHYLIEMNKVQNRKFRKKLKKKMNLIMKFPDHIHSIILVK